MNAFSSVQSLSRAQLFATPWTAAHQASLSHHQLPELAKTHIQQVGGAIQASSVIPFSSCLQPFPASGSFPMSQFFESGGQRIGASASASVLPNWGPKGGSLWAQKEAGREGQLPASSPGNSCPRKGKFHLMLLPSCSFQTEPA